MSTSRRAELQRILLATAAALIVGGVLAIGWISGWRGEVMTTASMGTTAPVGTLVVSRPAPAGDLRTGDVVVFHPPGQPNTTFVHRIVGVERSSGTPVLSTGGDISGSVDPWQVPADQIIGRTVTRVPAVGWLLRLLPWLAAGTVSVLVLTGPMGGESRRALRIVGFTAVVIFAVWHFRPLVGVELISSGATRHGGQATVVPTGVLPVKIHALHHAAGAAVLAPGQVGTVHASSLDARGHVSFVVSPHLYGWWWLLLATWPLPLLAGLMRRPGGEGGLSVA